MIIKSRFVVLARAGPKSVTTHLRYIERDGTTREGGRGQAYGPESDSADLKAFEARGRGDRHQFRMILSAEDATQLEDLQRFTREFMKRVEVDLQTPLDWVAVDHWDTDNPHTHIVLRGRSGDGGDLVIGPDYMSHGMRMRASDVATEWLGPRSELEIQESLRKEVAQERLTSLDRVLLEASVDGIVAFNKEPLVGGDSRRLIDRLRRLQAMGLARNVGNERWQLEPQFQDVLRAMGERGDIVRAINAALKGDSREIGLASGDVGVITGRLAGKGIVDELSDRTYVVLDGIDGRAHYAEMPVGTDLSEFPQDSIVQIGCRNGALARPRILCHLNIDEQVRTIGPTWLDKQLVQRAEFPNSGFGAVVKRALENRRQLLTELGFATLQGGNFNAPNLLAVLRTRELDATIREFSERSGKRFLQTPANGLPAGRAVRQLRLASGQFALLESEFTFSLVPWGRHLELPHSRPGLSR